jgi:hypothetical protein
VQPRVHDSVIRPREPDLFELPLRTVVLPAIDETVFVLVDLHTQQPGSVQEAPGVRRAITVRIVYN